MSGGIAYVLDADGTFSTRCNTELVELEPLEEADVETLRSLVESHLRHTGSPVAARVLEEWEVHLPLFAKVMPRDYRLALELQSQNGQFSGDRDATSSGGGGFLTTESERRQAAV
jgi:glutamate synthase domain-containing protein 3